MNKIIEEDIVKIINSNVDWSRFNNKTILITGANGFLPAYMVETLMYLNIHYSYDITVLCLVRNLFKAQSRFSHYSNNKHLIFLHQDVCNEINYDDRVDFIIHAASQASPKYYGIDPVGTLSANTLGTMNMLKFAHKKSIEAFLYFSSSEVYGILDETKIPTKESEYGYIDPTNVRSCYAESKRMGETICISWMTQFNVPVKIVRPFHIYGPGMALDDGRVYADFVSDIVNNCDIVMKSDGLTMRSFCYLSDSTIAFFMILLNGKNGEAYNVGNPDCEISIINLAQKLVLLFPERKISVIKKVARNVNYLNSEVLRNCPDLTKISMLGWKPEISINKGFYKTIKSYE